MAPISVAQRAVTSAHPLLSNLWFQDAVREVARHVSEGVPFMELVELHGPSSGKEPRYSSFKVRDEVVSAPQLWHSIAECLSGQDPDVLMLCKRVDSARDDATSAAAAALSSSRPDPLEEVERACRALVRSGIARGVVMGRVGDCCEGEGWAEGGAAVEPPAPRVRHTRGFQEVHYWGLVVQSRARTGVEGCYLLKTVRNTEPATACSCTHYSLTRICQGEGLESQFVHSWLARA